MRTKGKTYIVELVEFVLLQVIWGLGMPSLLYWRRLEPRRASYSHRPALRDGRVL